MDNFSIELGGTPVKITADVDTLDDSDGDLLGEARFTFDEETSARVASVVLVVYNGLGEPSESTLADTVEDTTGDPWDGSELVLGPDAGIAAVAYLAEQGEPFSFHWEGSGSAFWLFHDLAHADHDATPMELGDGTPAVDFPSPDAYSEDRANVDGARAAVAAGVSLDEVLGELERTREPFRERFSVDSTALDEVLRDVAKDLPEGDREQDYREHVRDLAVDYLEQNEDATADEVDPFEYADGSGWIQSNPGLVLAFSEYGDSEDYGAGIQGRAFGALLGDVSAVARDLAEVRDDLREELDAYGVAVSDVVVRDSGDGTADRYSVSIRYEEEVHAYAMSENATAPNGVNMCTDHPDAKGRALDAWDVPDDVREAIVQRVEQLSELVAELARSRFDEGRVRRSGRFAFSVKTYDGPGDLPAATWDEIREELGLDEGFGPEWYRERFEDRADPYGPRELSAEEAFEQANEDASERFGSGVSVYQEGRMGGWLVLDGLSADDLEPEELDALGQSLDAFGEEVRAAVADFPRAVAWNAGANWYEREQEEERAAARERAVAELGADVLRILGERSYARAPELDGDGFEVRSPLGDGLARDGFREVRDRALALGLIGGAS